MAENQAAKPFKMEISDPLKIMKQTGCEALWTHDLAAIRHAVGFTGSAGHLVWLKKGAPVLFVDGRYTLQAKKECAGIEAVTIPQRMIASIAENLLNRGLKKVAIDANNFTHREFKAVADFFGDKAEAVPSETTLQSFRMVKTEDELKIMRQAIAIASRSFKTVAAEWLKEGVTEAKFAWELEKAMREGGASGMSFDPLVATGDHAAIIHAKPTNRKFKSGECVIIDFGLVYKGYCTDRTDTVSIGKPGAKMQEIFDVVKASHDLAIAAIKPGVKTTKIDAISREYIAQKGYGQYFTHGLGHGVGLEIHEMPAFSPMMETVLKEGMVVTVEPGVYIEGLGGVRVEDMILVTKDGCEVLTPKRPAKMPIF